MSLCTAPELSEYNTEKEVVGKAWEERSGE